MIIDNDFIIADKAFDDDSRVEFQTKTNDVDAVILSLVLELQEQQNKTATLEKAMSVFTDPLFDDKDTKFEGFVRAFWRRIEPHKNEFGKELPKELPIQFRAFMGTALAIFKI